MLDRDHQGAYNATIRWMPLAFAAATTLSVEAVSVQQQTENFDQMP